MEEKTTVMDMLTLIRQELGQLKKPSCNHCDDEENRRRSRSTKHLVHALAKAQATFTPVDTDFIGQLSNRDATYRAIHMAIVPKLNHHGLSITHERCDETDGSMWLYSYLNHESGEYIRTHTRLLDVKDLQALEHNLEYHKKMNLKALVSVPLTLDPADDSGDLYTNDRIEADIKQAAPVYSKSPHKNLEPVSKAELDHLYREFEGYPELYESIMQKHGIRSMADLKKEYYPQVMSELQKIKVNISRAKNYTKND